MPIILSLCITACTIQSRVPDFEYPDTNLPSDAPLPKLVPTDTLKQYKRPVTSVELNQLKDIDNRAAQLRQRSQRLSIARISPARIDRLKRRAQALKNAQF